MVGASELSVGDTIASKSSGQRWRVVAIGGGRLNVQVEPLAQPGRAYWLDAGQLLGCKKLEQEVDKQGGLVAVGQVWESEANRWRVVGVERSGKVQVELLTPSAWDDGLYVFHVSQFSTMRLVSVEA